MRLFLSKLGSVHQSRIQSGLKLSNTTMDVVLGPCRCRHRSMMNVGCFIWVSLADEVMPQSMPELAHYNSSGTGRVAIFDLDDVLIDTRKAAYSRGIGEEYDRVRANPTLDGIHSIYNHFVGKPADGVREIVNSIPEKEGAAEAAFHLGNMGFRKFAVTNNAIAALADLDIRKKFGLVRVGYAFKPRVVGGVVRPEPIFTKPKEEYVRELMEAERPEKGYIVTDAFDKRFITKIRELPNVQPECKNVEVLIFDGTGPMDPIAQHFGALDMEMNPMGFAPRGAMHYPTHSISHG